MSGRSTPRRWAAGLSVLAIFALNLVSAAPAWADYVYVWAGAGDVTMAKGSVHGKTLGVYVSGNEATDAFVSIDFSGLAGIATATFPSACPIEGTKATCPIPVDGTATFSYSILVGLKPVAGASIGASGKLIYSAWAKEFPPSPYPTSSTVTLSEGPDLWTEVEWPEQDPPADPGDNVTAPLTVGNRGDQTVFGVDVEVFYTRDVIPVQYEQCTYREDSAHFIRASCSFDGEIAPGDFVEFVDDANQPLFAGELEADAMGIKSIFYSVYPKGGAPAPMGEVLALSATKRHVNMRLKPARVRAAAEEVDMQDNYGGARWWVENHRDLAAAGDTGYGQVGDIVTLRLGIKNTGVGSVDIWTSGGESYAYYSVKIPPGLELVGQPADCVMYPHYTFVCQSSPDYIAAGRTDLFEFKLKIHHPSDFTGEVSLNREDWPYEDENPANNVTPFRIILGSPPPAGSLPTTGGRLTMLIAAGAALIVVGALAFRLPRRRRRPAV